MNTLLAFLIGLMFAGGIYSLLRRSLFRLVIGIILISQAANLLVFTAPRVHRGNPPLIDEADTVLNGSVADPLPQALVLTAIVIGLGVISFVLALIHAMYERIGHEDLAQLNTTTTERESS